MIVEAIIGGPENLSAREIHDHLGIGEKMVTAARSAVKEAETQQTSNGPRSRSRIVSSAMKRKRKTTKFSERRAQIRKFYEENSTPTSRTRDVVSVKVSCFE